MSNDTASWTAAARRHIDWLAAMNEDDALALANRLLMEDKVAQLRVLGL